MLDKAIKYNKEYRKIYYGSKAIDKSCRNHGTCAYCENNRKYKNKKRAESACCKMQEYLNK